MPPTAVSCAFPLNMETGTTLAVGGIFVRDIPTTRPPDVPAIRRMRITT